MIHYHGGPITPLATAVGFWPRRHGFCSFEHPGQVLMMFELCQSVALDNGAFSKWRAGKGEVDVKAYAAWVRQFERHPAFDFAIIPDVIDGDEFENDKMIARWTCGEMMRHGVPVWHLHEKLDRLEYLVRAYPRVALGSSGKYATPGADAWWDRMDEVREVACDFGGRPKTKLHGLRMLNPTIFSHIPFSSADSCNVAMNVGKDVKWKGTYQPITGATRALILAERIEMHACAASWSKHRGTSSNPELIG